MGALLPNKEDSSFKNKTEGKVQIIFTISVTEKLWLLCFPQRHRKQSHPSSPYQSSVSSCYLPEHALLGSLAAGCENMRFENDLYVDTYLVNIYDCLETALKIKLW